jgi:hypothetical protein
VLAYSSKDTSNIDIALNNDSLKYCVFSTEILPTSVKKTGHLFDCQTKKELATITFDSLWSHWLGFISNDVLNIFIFNEKISILKKDPPVSTPISIDEDSEYVSVFYCDSLLNTCVKILGFKSIGNDGTVALLVEDRDGSLKIHICKIDSNTMTITCDYSKSINIGVYWESKIGISPNGCFLASVSYTYEKSLQTEVIIHNLHTKNKKIIPLPNIPSNITLEDIVVSNDGELITLLHSVYRGFVIAEYRLNSTTEPNNFNFPREFTFNDGVVNVARLANVNTMVLIYNLHCNNYVHVYQRENK